MWSRVIEFSLACWLAISPFVFQHADNLLLWGVDFGSAALVVCLALSSFWRPLRRAHLLILVVAVFLICFGRIAGNDNMLPAYQNQIVIGLLLLMFAIVPNHASDPPLVRRINET